MATNNLINLRDAGIASYDGAGTFSTLSIPVVVADGGLGVSSTTAYAVLCGGTTTTNPVQSIASVGTSGQALTSNGAGNLPTFQNLANTFGYVIFFQNSNTGANPADGTTYFPQPSGGINITFSDGRTRFMIPKDGTIKRFVGVVYVAGVLGSAENVSIYVRLNATTDVTVTTTSQWTATENAVSNTAMSQAVVAGDFIEVKIVTPTWVTNPTTVTMSASISIE